MSFALFFLGEYANMILMSRDDQPSCSWVAGWLRSDYLTLGLDGARIWLIAKICVMLFGFIWVRATFPRYRYDQLMRLGWKVFLPGSLVYLVLVAGVLLAMGWLPNAT